VDTQERIREASWLGTEEKRRADPGLCLYLPPTRPPRHVPRFLVPAGTRCAVKRVSDDEWRFHVTARPNGFERFERWVKSETGNFFEFRADGGWLMLVASRFVVRREAAC
jgi:hypothetical protein